MMRVKMKPIGPILLFVLSLGVALASDREYSAVYNDFLMGDYDLAIFGFQDFLTTYPDSEYSDNASFFLGRCYEKKKSYQEAIQAFDQLVERYPKSTRAPLALYRKAFILEKLERYEEASNTWNKLMDLYPDSPQAIEHRKLLGTDPPEFRPQSPTRPSV